MLLRFFSYDLQVGSDVVAQFNQLGNVAAPQVQGWAIWSLLPEPERTLPLLAAITGLRISECLGLQWETWISGRS